MRAIDADALLDGGIRVSHGFENTNIIYIPMGEVRRAIKKAPTLDVAPVRHGHWAEKKLGLVCREVVCSECEQPPIKTGSCSYWMGDYAPSYCPNCGAKMDAGQEDDSHG